MADESKKQDKDEKKDTPKDNIVTSKHSVKIGGKNIKYTVTTGTMILKEEAWDKDKHLSQEHKCSMAFKINKDELVMYRKWRIPLPRNCPWSTPSS